MVISALPFSCTVLGANSKRFMFESGEKPALIQTYGLNKRNNTMLDWVVKHFRLLEPPSSGVYFVPSERGPRFCQNMTADRFPTCVPKAKWIVVSAELNRIGWLCPEEFLCGQQMALTDYVESPEGFDIIRADFSYSALIKFGGNAFHSSSAGCFGIAVLLLPRFATLLPYK